MTRFIAIFHVFTFPRDEVRRSVCCVSSSCLVVLAFSPTSPRVASAVLAPCPDGACSFSHFIQGSATHLTRSSVNRWSPLDGTASYHSNIRVREDEISRGHPAICFRCGPPKSVAVSPSPPRCVYAPQNLEDGIHLLRNYAAPQLGGGGLGWDFETLPPHFFSFEYRHV